MLASYGLNAARYVKSSRNCYIVMDVCLAVKLGATRKYDTCEDYFQEKTNISLQKLCNNQTIFRKHMTFFCLSFYSQSHRVRSVPNGKNLDFFQFRFQNMLFWEIKFLLTILKLRPMLTFQCEVQTVLLIRNKCQSKRL